MNDEIDTLEPEAIRQKCQAILQGTIMPGSLRNHGDDPPFLVIVEAYNRCNSHRQREKASGIISAMLSVGNELLETLNGPISGGVVNAKPFEAWLYAAEMIGDSRLEGTCCDILESIVLKKGDYLSLAALASQAASSSFGNDKSGLGFWQKYLLQGPIAVLNYAIEYFIEHEPLSDILPQSLARLFELSMLNVTDVVPEYLLWSLIQSRIRRSLRVDETRQQEEAIASEVFAHLPRSRRIQLLDKFKTNPKIPIHWERALRSLIIRPMSTPEITAMLDKINIDELDMFSTKHPPEMTDAVEEFCKQWKSFSAVITAKAVHVYKYDYPSNLLESQKSRSHATFYDGLRRVTEKYPDIGSLSGEDTDLSEFDIRAATRKKILLQVAFFFRTFVRRGNHFGVVPLGTQKAIGIVVPRALIDKMDLSERIKGSISTERNRGELSGVQKLCREYAGDLDISVMNEQLSGMFLSKVLQVVRSTGGKVYYRSGFVQADILAELLNREQQLLGKQEQPKISEILDYYDSLLEEQRTGDETTFDMFWSQTHPGGDMNRPKARNWESSIAVFDLGRIEAIKHANKITNEGNGSKSKDGTFRVFVVEHNINIPAGIGFSLPMTPFLFRRERWEEDDPEPTLLYQHLQRLAWVSYVEERSASASGEAVSYVDEYKKIGVELVRPALKPTRDAGENIRPFPVAAKVQR
jgi:hypothetical protein